MLCVFGLKQRPRTCPACCIPDQALNPPPFPPATLRARAQRTLAVNKARKRQQKPSVLRKLLPSLVLGGQEVHLGRFLPAGSGFHRPGVLELPCQSLLKRQALTSGPHFAEECSARVQDTWSRVQKGRAQANEPVVIQAPDPCGVGCHVTENHICSPTRKQFLNSLEGSRVGHISGTQKSCSFQGGYVKKIYPKHEANRSTGI